MCCTGANHHPAEPLSCGQAKEVPIADSVEEVGSNVVNGPVFSVAHCHSHDAGLMVALDVALSTTKTHTGSTSPGLNSFTMASLAFSNGLCQHGNMLAIGVGKK